MENYFNDFIFKVFIKFKIALQNCRINFLNLLIHLILFAFQNL